MATYEERLAIAMQELAELEEQKKKVLLAQSWETKDGRASRSIINVSFREILNAIEKKKKEIKMLEDLIAGTNKSVFRVGVYF